MLENARFIADESTQPEEIPTEILRRVVRNESISRYTRMIANAIVKGREKWPPLARQEMVAEGLTELE